MDAQQGRAGGVTALVAIGPLPATSAPVGSIPTIRAPRPPSGNPAIGSGPRADLWERSRCEGPVGGDAAFETHALDATRTLVLVSCGEDGPYNRFQDPYVVAGSSIAVAPFDSDVRMGERGAPPQIVTGGWDVPTGTLTSYERGRELGDCASQETFVWDGSICRFIEKDELDE